MKYAAILIILALFVVGCDHTPMTSTPTKTSAIKQTSEQPDNVCDDSNPCTEDYVDQNSFLCAHALIADCCAADIDCADGLFCNGDETCDLTNNVCLAGTAPNADDAIDCTVDACDEDNDVIINNPDDSFCDDQDPCTADSCDPAIGCVFTPIELCCAADIDCAAEENCDNGTCVALDCDDASACTTDTVVDHACVNESIAGCCRSDLECLGIGETSWGYPTVDATMCEVDADCSIGEYCVGALQAPLFCLPLAYDYGCTVDPIDNPADYDAGLTGSCEMCADSNDDGFCSSVETFCSGGLDEDGDGEIDCLDADCDGEICSDTNGTCQAGVCVGCINDDACDDTNPCTDDTCEGEICVYTPNNDACEDGDACTTDDECKAEGICMPGPILDCNDGDACTTDSCEAAIGCMYEDILECCNADEDCDDGDTSTFDTCADNACVFEQVPTGLYTFSWTRKDGNESFSAASLNLHTCTPVTWEITPDQVTVVYGEDPSGCLVNIVSTQGIWDPGCWNQGISMPSASYPDNDGDGIADVCGLQTMGNVTLGCDGVDGVVMPVPNFMGTGADHLLTCTPPQP